MPETCVKPRLCLPWRSKLPGTLEPQGTAMVEDVLDPAQMKERERDLGRSLQADNVQVRNLDESPMMIGDGIREHFYSLADILRKGDESRSDIEALSAFLKRFTSLRGDELRLLRDRVVNLLSVTPGLAFALAHKVPPLFPEAKFLLQVATAPGENHTGEVRVCWHAFVVDKPAPGLKTSPYTVVLASENLVRARDRSDPKSGLASPNHTANL